MDTYEFLRHMLPATGYYVATVINPDGTRRQTSFQTVDRLAAAVAILDQQGHNTYYAVSAFKEKGNRKQSNVRATKLFALDIDCGATKPYLTWREGLHALNEFVTQLNLPKPLVVNSGLGLHVYWVLADEAEPDQWQPVANALKAAASAHKLHIDPAVTADSARILRPIGTTNVKHNCAVTLLINAPATDISVLATQLGAFIAPSAASTQSTPLSPLAQNLQTTQEYPPSNAQVVAAKCGQIAWGVANQAEVPEPFWYAMLGIAAVCKDSDATALAWSEAHPQYDAAKTLQKLAQWKAATTGPTTCAKFHELRPAGCFKCKLKDKLGSPAQLGIQHLEVASDATAPNIIATEIPVPRPFKRTPHGMKITIDETDVDVCPFEIYPTAYGLDESLGYETARYHWNRHHHGWTELVLRQAYLTGVRLKEFTTEVADRGIVLPTSKQTELFQTMLRTYMDELRRKRAMTNNYASMGWKDNYTQFVLGETLLRRMPDGTVSEETISMAHASRHIGADLWGQAGDLASWTAFTELLDTAQLDAHKVSLGLGFAAPLYAFTGLSGITVSLYGPTGGGKTLAQLMQQSIWGDPSKLHFAAKFTQNTLFSRMGLYNNLPMTIDEATMVTDKDVGDFLYWVTQGRDKARLNRNAEERLAKTWATTTTISTNRSWAAKLVASGMETDAQMARLMELQVPMHPVFTKNSDAGRKIYQFVHTHYGLAGRVFITKLLELGADNIRALITEANDTFKKRYSCKFTGVERYWEQCLVLQELASKLAYDWRLIRYDYRASTAWAVRQLGTIRQTIVDNSVDAFDLLASYIADTADSQVQIFHTIAHKPTMDHSRIPRAGILVRFDFYRKRVTDSIHAGTVMIDRMHFRRWISQRGADYRTFMTELQKAGVDATPKHQKAYLGKDTPVKLGQVYVIGVNLNHPRLQGMISDADESLDDLTYGKIKLVP